MPATVHQINTIRLVCMVLRLTPNRRGFWISEGQILMVIGERLLLGGAKDCLGCVAGNAGCSSAGRRWHAQGDLSGVSSLSAGLYWKEPQTALGEPHPHSHWGKTIPLPPL